MSSIRRITMSTGALLLTLGAAAPAMAFNSGSAPDRDRGCQFFTDPFADAGPVPDAQIFASVSAECPTEGGTVEASGLAGYAQWRVPYYTWGGLGSFNDAISSVYVPDGCRAIVYENKLKGGASEALPPGYWDLSGTAWNDRISSTDCFCEDPRTALNFAFDGVDDYAQVPSGPWFSSSTFTISAWIRMDAYNWWSRVIDFGNGQAQDNVILAASRADLGKPRFSIRVSGIEYSVDSNIQIPLGEWTNLTAVFDSGVGQLYMNGDLVATNSSMVAPANVTRNSCYIGRSNWTADAYFDGDMADVRILNVALSSDEVGRLVSGVDYHSGSWLTGEQARFRYKDGSTLRDMSLNAQDGTYYTP